MRFSCLSIAQDGKIFLKKIRYCKSGKIKSAMLMKLE